MTRTKILLGLALAASLGGLAPAVEATPIAASRAAVTMSATDGAGVIQVRGTRRARHGASNPHHRHGAHPAHR